MQISQETWQLFSDIFWAGENFSKWRAQKC